NQSVSEFQHSAPPLSGFTNVPKGVGGPSVAQSWIDSQQNEPPSFLATSGTTPPPSIPPINTSLAASLAPTDSRAVFQDVHYLPTQNRWRGKVENEILLFEGTSGGIADQNVNGFRVDVVYHGIDGTI